MNHSLSHDQPATFVDILCHGVHVPSTWDGFKPSLKRHSSDQLRCSLAPETSATITWCNRFHGAPVPFFDKKILKRTSSNRRGSQTNTMPPPIQLRKRILDLHLSVSPTRRCLQALYTSFCLPQNGATHSVDNLERLYLSHNQEIPASAFTNTGYNTHYAQTVESYTKHSGHWDHYHATILFPTNGYWAMRDNAGVLPPHRTVPPIAIGYQTMTIHKLPPKLQFSQSRN